MQSNDFQEQCQLSVFHAICCVNLSFFSSKQCIIRQFIIRFSVCDIHNYQGLGKCDQPQPSAQLITLNIYIDLAKAKSEALNNIYSLFNKNRVMLSGEGNAGER